MTSETGFDHGLYQRFPTSEPRPEGELPELKHVLIIDGGADNHECDDLLSAIATARRATGRSFPSVILLSTRNARPEDLSLAHIVDAVVAKPITLDRLQPVVDRIAARAR